MTEELFLEKLVNVLDTEDEITMDRQLEDMEEWDSLSIVSFMAMANTACGKHVTPAEVKAAKTVEDLYTLVK